MNLRTFFAQWNERRVGLRQISAQTAEGYASALAAFLDAHGARPLDAVTPDAVEAFYIARLKSVSPATLKGTHVLLVALFKEARRRKLISASPMDEVAAPKGASSEKKALDAAQIRALLAYAADRPLLLRAVRLAIATGLRRGELCALLWSDLDLEAGVLRVSKNVVRVGKVEVVTTPKTAAGVRELALPADLLDELRASAGAPGEPLLRTQQGGRPSLAYLSELLKSALRAIGCDEGFSLHSTRHTHATHLLRATGNIKAVSVRLGHADTSVTMRTYAKVLNGDDAALAKAIGSVMGA